jgi:cytochrome c biogenesis protein CcmG, thiol:disulfide interchange protein DsbE
MLVGFAAAEALPPVTAGQIAPDFSARTLDGKTLRLSKLRGKVVILDFWTTT